MSNELQQSQQKVWIKEQENNALKVQNRHLIAKLEDAEQGAKPNQINTQQIAQQISNEVQAFIKPVLVELQKQNQVGQNGIEKSLTQAFEMMQATLRGVYQQSQRSQQAVDALTDHSRDTELRANEARKADQVFYQDKIFSLLVSFFERVERQLDQRLSALSAVDHMINKQNEALVDIDAIKAVALGIQKSTESTRNEMVRVEKGATEMSQKLIEIEVQGRNSEEITRDALQQIQNHRSEFKLARGEIRSMVDQAQKLSEKIALVDGHMNEAIANIQNQQRDQDRIRNELREIEATDSIENLIEVKNDDITAVQSIIDSGLIDETTPEEVTAKNPDEKEDLVMILELLKSQKTDLKKVAKEAETYLKEYRASGAPSGSVADAALTIENEGNSVIKGAENYSPVSEKNK